MEWLIEADPAVLAAIFTGLLAVFALVQVGLEVSRVLDRRREARTKAIGPAWLARRTLDKGLEAAERDPDPKSWARTVGKKTTQDILQDQMLQVLSLSADAGGQTAKKGQEAFAEFLDYMSQVNAVLEKDYSGRGSAGDPIPTEEDLEEMENSRAIAIRAQREAIAHLSFIAPFRMAEMRIDRSLLRGILKWSRDREQ